MESAAAAQGLGRPARLNAGLIAILLVLSAMAWLISDARMGGMDAGPGTPVGTIGFFIVAWVAMMAAMMFPSVAPLVLMYARVARGKRERDIAETVGGTAALLGGYLLAWTLAGLAAYTIFEALGALEIEALGWDRGGPYVAGGVIVGAAIYQLSPLKNVCLRHCRHPLMFLLHSWRPGRLGALRMGLEHGGWCVGCCWMLMAALFAVGVMSLGWMAFIAALIAVEKLLPWKSVANLGVAVLLLALGLLVALSPESVPGLTIPGSPEATQAMQAMGMEPGAAMEPGAGMPAAGN